MNKERRESPEHRQGHCRSSSIVDNRTFSRKQSPEKSGSSIEGTRSHGPRGAERTVFKSIAVLFVVTMMPWETSASAAGESIKKRPCIFELLRRPLKEGPRGAPTQHTRSPIVTGTSVLGLKVQYLTSSFCYPMTASKFQYRDGVMLASDTLASYGSLAMFKVNTTRENSCIRL